MNKIEKEMEEYYRKQEEERLAFLDKCLSKLTDPDLAYRCLALRIGERFNIKAHFDNVFPDPVYAILNYYVEEVDEDFETWLNKDDAPLIRKARELPKIFPELVFKHRSNKKIAELANEVYGLELEFFSNELGEDYVYAYSFDFNSFKPIPVNEIQAIKQEISILEKYSYDATELKEKLKTYNLPDQLLGGL